MGQITSFRVARAPQRTSDGRNDALFIDDTPRIGEWLDAGDDAQQLAIAYLNENDLIPPVMQFRTNDENVSVLLDRVRRLDRLLLSNNNRVGWDAIAQDVVATFDGQPRVLIAR